MNKKFSKNNKEIINSIENLFHESKSVSVEKETFLDRPNNSQLPIIKSKPIEDNLNDVEINSYENTIVLTGLKNRPDLDYSDKEKQNGFQINLSEISSNNSLNEIRLAVENAKSQFDSNISNDNLSISNNNLINNKEEIIELIDKRIDEHLEKLKNHEN